MKSAKYISHYFITRTVPQAQQRGRLRLCSLAVSFHIIFSLSLWLVYISGGTSGSSKKSFDTGLSSTPQCWWGCESCRGLWEDSFPLGTMLARLPARPGSTSNNSRPGTALQRDRSFWDCRFVVFKNLLVYNSSLTVQSAQSLQNWSVSPPALC